MTERNRLNIILELSASQAHIEDVASTDQFLELLKHIKLLGDASLPKDKQGLVTGYITANLAGGEELERFVTHTLAHIPDSTFNEPLSPKTGVNLGDVIAMARFALIKWSFGRPAKNGNGSGE